MKKYSSVLILVILINLGCGEDDFGVSFAEMNNLFIPELIDSRDFNGPIEINIQSGTHDFFDGVASQTKGFNGNYLGPTIKMYNNEDINLVYTNSIGETTTVHGHGLHVAGEFDGGPHIRIEPGDQWDVTIPIAQEASTSWYHPHLMGSTAHLVHAGLAGFYFVEDDNSQSLEIPKTYGVDDIPIVVQDREFVDGKMVDYPIGMTNDLREPTLVINGTVDPFLSVPMGNVRLRLLNASNARSYEFFIKGGFPFYKIATEGGFLNSPVQMTSLRMSPGERNEIIVDMSNGDVEIMAYYLPQMLGNANPDDDPLARVLYLEGDENLSVENSTLPNTLNNIQDYNESEVVLNRTFNIQGGRINGELMDINVINEAVNLGELEKWTINSGRHPFHMHGAAFLILSINGNLPAPEDRGWKDTVMANGTVEVLIRFDHEATDEFPYMYHCHILEHEDNGMMGQFTVK